MSRLITIIVVAAFIAPACADQPIVRNAQGQRIWHITDYLKGTSAQIHELLVGEIHRLSDKVRLTEKAIADDSATLEADRKPLTTAYLKGTEYQDARAEVIRCKVALDKAHAAEDTAAAMSAGSAYNKARDAVKSMERQAEVAAERNEDVKQDAIHLKNDQANLNRLQASLKKAQKWHDELVGAMRNSAMIQWPLGEQSTGILGEVLPTEFDRNGNLVCLANVHEDVSSKDSGEGMVNVKQRMHPVRVIIKDSGLAAGDVKLSKPMPFARNVEVETGRYTPGREVDAVVVVRAKHADLDDLLDAIGKP